MELPQYERLGQDDLLRSPSGRYMLHYDDEGVAVIADTASDEVIWRAGEAGQPAAGWLLLGSGDAVQVEDPEEYKTIWRSAIAATGARKMTLTDDGDLELLDVAGAAMFNSRTGPVEPRVMLGSAPAADITTDRVLLRQGGRTRRRTVAREPDGSLRISDLPVGAGAGSIYRLSGPLARWLEQDGTVLTWRLLPEHGTHGPKLWTLCLVDRDGAVLWHEHPRDLAVELPAAEPHAYGGPELGSGGRLRRQSLTSPSGAHTLVHQEDGNLVLYCNPVHRAVWATGTWWAGDAWAELTPDGELVVRNPCGARVWSSGTAGSGGRRLVVHDDGRVTLLTADGTQAWSADAHASCTEPGMNVARGSVMRRGQVLQRQSLTSDDGGTVLAHSDDRGLVLYGEDGHCIWQDNGAANGSTLALDEDGMLRVRGEDGAVRLELGGPGDELRVLPEQVRLSRNDGTVVWRQGEAEAEGFTAWMDALVGEGNYCATVIHDITPDEALLRLGAAAERITSGTWEELLTQVQIEEIERDGIVVAAFALGPHTLLVEDNNYAGVNCPELSRGTFAVCSFKNHFSNGSRLVLFRDGAKVDEYNEYGPAEAATAEVSAAMRAMAVAGTLDVDDVGYTFCDKDLELLCRIAGVQPTVAMVTGVARWAIIPRVPRLKTSTNVQPGS